MPAGQGDPSNLDTYNDGPDDWASAQLYGELWQHMKDVHGLDMEEDELSAIIDIVDDPEGERDIR